MDLGLNGKVAVISGGSAGFGLAVAQGLAAEDRSLRYPEEIANFYVFLCSNRASYSVGSTYYIDGGWLRTV